MVLPVGDVMEERKWWKKGGNHEAMSRRTVLVHERYRSNVSCQAYFMHGFPEKNGMVTLC